MRARVRILQIDGIIRFGCLHGDCDRHYSTPGNLNHHFTRDHDLKRFRCPWPGCGAVYTRAIKLANHARNVHRGQFFVCARHGCRKLYLSPELLAAHERFMHPNQHGQPIVGMTGEHVDDTPALPSATVPTAARGAAASASALLSDAVSPANPPVHPVIVPAYPVAAHHAPAACMQSSDMCAPCDIARTIAAPNKPNPAPSADYALGAARGAGGELDRGSETACAALLSLKIGRSELPHLDSAGLFATSNLKPFPPLLPPATQLEPPASGHGFASRACGSLQAPRFSAAPPDAAPSSTAGWAAPSTAPSAYDRHAHACQSSALHDAPPHLLVGWVGHAHQGPSRWPADGHAASTLGMFTPPTVAPSGVMMMTPPLAPYQPQLTATGYDNNGAPSHCFHHHLPQHQRQFYHSSAPSEPQPQLAGSALYAGHLLSAHPPFRAGAPSTSAPAPTTDAATGQIEHLVGVMVLPAVPDSYVQAYPYVHPPHAQPPPQLNFQPQPQPYLLQRQQPCPAAPRPLMASAAGDTLWTTTTPRWCGKY
jgi:hypothetical protein